MKVFVINLPHRTERLEQFTKESKEQGFDFEVQCGEEFKHDRKKGVTISHKRCVQKAKDAGLEMVAIFEDDCVFLGKGAFDYFVENIPKKFHLYFTMVYVGNITEENKINSICSGMTGYIIHESFYDTFLSLPESAHIDRASTALFKDYDFYVCPKFVCEQDGSFSDNVRKTVGTYRPLLRGRKLYEGQ